MTFRFGIRVGTADSRADIIHVCAMGAGTAFTLMSSGRHL